jgi:cell division protein ZapA
MAHVSLTIAGRSYRVGCESGEEDRVRALGHEVDRCARAIGDGTGVVAEGLLLVLAGLTLADELDEARASAGSLAEENTALKTRLADLEGQIQDSHEALRRAQHHLEQRREDTASRARQEDEVARAIEALAARIETVAERFATP